MRYLLVLLALGFGTGSAQAQTAPATPGLGGTPIAGLCLLSRQAVFANAKVGVAASARLAQLAEDVRKELAAERGSLEAELKAFQAEQAKMTQAQRDAREKALSPRLQAAQAKAQQRNAEIDATRQKALAQISDQAQPVIAQVYKAHGCGLLVDRNSVLGGNLANDLTADVVKGLDAKLTTISFNRETLPAPAPAQ
ncbi:OmpH family outer membrane protein [Sphingomonas sp. KR3-1]|uniref:OmpH family outer membrane protein n=1 Tax=Sphingomonas sp. KR3-1 TaxID=3156611 RepID=UPI0032B5993E